MSGSRNALLASCLLILVFSTSALPYCSYSTSACCNEGGVSNMGELVFYNTVDGPVNWGVTQTTSWDSFATCSLLNVVPNASNALCKESNPGSVCDAIKASSQAKERFDSGESVLGYFIEPGTCNELQQEKPTAHIGMRTFDWTTMGFSSSCFGLSVFDPENMTDKIHTLGFQLKCPAKDVKGLSVEVAWFDGASDVCEKVDSNPHVVDAVLLPESWTSVPNLPRWTCLDIAPRGQTVTTSSYRMFLMSIGDIPCQGTTTTSNRFLDPTNSASATMSLLWLAQLLMLWSTRL